MIKRLAQIFLPLLICTPMVIADESPKSKKLGLQMMGFACGIGFGGWMTGETAAEEEKCDRENLEVFQKNLNKCADSSKNEASMEIRGYDLDKDGCATCKDYFEWKKMIARLYEKRERSNDGSALRVEGCKEK